MEMPDSAAIGFSTFVGNPTRGGELKTDDLTEFYVFGGIDTYNDIFNDQKVEKSGDSWIYSPLRYWEAGKTYTFNAYAPTLPEGAEPSVNTNGGIDIADFTQGDGDNNLDLLVAAKQTKTMDATISTEPGVVQFTFSHILSMVKFTFVSEFGDGVTVTVSNVKLKGVKSKGSYVANPTAVWTMADPAVTTVDYTMSNSDITLTSADVEGKSSLGAIVIPQVLTDDAVTVEFNVKAVYTGTDNVVNGVDGTYVVKATLPASQNWEIAYRYNYVAKLNAVNTQNPEEPTTLYPIQFALADDGVTAWTDYTEGGNVTVGE